jgi:hypothetical protein
MRFTKISFFAVIAFMFLICYFYVYFFIYNIIFIETYDVFLDSTLLGFKINSEILKWNFFYLDLYIVILLFMILFNIFNNTKRRIKPRLGLCFMTICIIVTFFSNFILLSIAGDSVVNDFVGMKLIIPENFQNGLSTDFINMGVVLSIIFAFYFIYIEKQEK